MLIISSARCLRYASTHRLLRSEQTCLRRAQALTHLGHGAQSSTMPAAQPPTSEQRSFARECCYRPVQLRGAAHSHSH